MRWVLLSLLFISCNQKVLYFIREDKVRMKQISLLAKKGHYTTLVGSCQSDKTSAFHLYIVRGVCDSIQFDRFSQELRKRDEISGYLILSKNGTDKIIFSSDEIQMLSDLKKVVDSMGWCQSSILSPSDSLLASKNSKRKQPTR